MTSPVGRRDPVTELDARERAAAALDPGTFRELIDPFDRVMSPHLLPQGITAQSDDGVVVARGTIDAVDAVVIALDGRFQGGGIGEVNGAKIAGALELALGDAEGGTPIRPVLFLETGGIRLQEANLGLLAIAEIHGAIAALRRHTPVVGVIAGMVGCFGGMGITAGLCSDLIITPQGRLGLNGPEVVEQEAGVAEWDARDRARIWRTIGGSTRASIGLADVLVADDTGELREALRQIFRRGARPDHECRSALVDQALRAVDSHPSGDTSMAATSDRGRIWFRALADRPAGRESGPTGGPVPSVPSVLTADTRLGQWPARLVSVVPDPDSRWPRARQGEVGVAEAMALAASVRQLIELDRDAQAKSVLVAIVDVPSQAYGYQEELLGIHQALAGAVDAYSAARLAGHPVISLLVGSAISGGFLAHGLQANRILALDDDGVTVQAMSRESTARVTRRSVAELERIAREVPATAYDGGTFARLGAVHRLITVDSPDGPTPADVAAVRASLIETVDDILSGPVDLSPRLSSWGARLERAASRRVRDLLAATWNPSDGAT